MSDTLSRADWELERQARVAGYRSFAEFLAADQRRRQIEKLEREFAESA